MIYEHLGSQSVSQPGVYYSHTYSNQTYGIATLMSKGPYTVGMHRVLSTHYIQMRGCKVDVVTTCVATRSGESHYKFFALVVVYSLGLTSEVLS